MPLKASSPATDYEEIDRWAGGVGWIAHPEEDMQRASHAIVDDGDVWVIDPVDAPGIDDLLAELGDVQGVVVLLDRHTRDAAAVANRHDVEVYLPVFVECDVDAPIERFAGPLPGTDYDLIHTVNWPGWSEAALFDGETLVVADALGTADYFTTKEERIGVHPLLRLLPPNRLRGIAPKRILTGHGAGIMDDGARALAAAFDNARPGLPRVWWNGLKSMLG